MDSAIIIAALGVVAVLVAALTGLLGKIWLALFKQSLNLPFGKKDNTDPDA